MFFKLFARFLLPAALLGIPAKVIAIVSPLHLFAQFWYHTVHIGKLGFLEKIIVTPSHHRVHHAVNPEYIDKNFSQIFIIWDKLFGTFQEELPGVKPVYGITVPVSTWNPVKINFLHLGNLIRDAWNTQSRAAKWLIWFKPTGWRPDDVKERFPVYKPADLSTFEKYKTFEPRGYRLWLWGQLIALLIAISYLFGNIAAIGAPHIYTFGLYIFFFVYALGECIDNKSAAIYWSVLKFMCGISLCWFLYSTMPASNLLYIFLSFMMVYSFIDLPATYFILQKMKQHHTTAITLQHKTSVS